MNGARLEAAVPVLLGFLFLWILQSLWVGDKTNGWLGWLTWWCGVGAAAKAVHAYAWRRP